MSASASGAAVPAPRGFVGSNASAIGGGCNKIHLVAGLEELVAARSVPEPYLVSLHDATVAFNAKQSRRKS
ncbi:hypothetical protein ACF1DY_36015, partial [Streptomyces albus]